MPLAAKPRAVLTIAIIVNALTLALAAALALASGCTPAAAPVDATDAGVTLGEGEGAAGEGEGVVAGEGEGEGVVAGEGEGEGTASTCAGDGVIDGCEADGSTGDLTCALEHDGLARTFILHVPTSLSASPTLVLNFHGVRTSASIQRYLSKMNDASDEQGFLVVYPEGTGPSTDESWNAGTCCDGSVTANVDDVGFARAIVATVSAAFCVDPHKVFATGLSNGGHMAYRLGCEAADLFGAISPVAGVLTFSPCTPSRPVPLLHFHGDADPLVNYSVGIGGGGAEDNVARWAAFDSCGDTSTVTYTNGEASCASFPDCAAGSDVELCTIHGGGHQWPGGNDLPLLGHNTTDISATEFMLTFFDAHPLP